MRLIDSDKSSFRVFEAAAVSFFFLLVFYPGFVFLKTTPMLGLSWELMDPVVSFANFEPSFKVFQYELVHHRNLLWSNLRSMGLPLLANDIHAAPLFPLTLLLFWVPAEYFWNVFVVARLMLMGIGTYLLARNFLQFRAIPAAFFVLCFIYSFFVLQWMNHSWQNGLLAGIWYLYFLSLLPGRSKPPWNLKRFAVVVGLAMGVYAMVTCGFPEAAAMFAVLVVLVYTPFIVQLFFSGGIRPAHYLFDLVLAHAVGFALSSAQIFSVYEMLSLYEAAEKRGTYGLRQFPMEDFFPFWAEKIGLITGAKPSLFKDSRTYLGLVPLFFFLVGFAWTTKNIRKIGYRQIGALLCGIFIVLKFFPFWDAFNRVVGSLPVLKESYFFVYFLSIFLWFFAYFAARGVQTVLYEERSDPGRFPCRWSLFVLGCAGTVLALVWLSIPVLYQMTFPELLRNTREHVHLVVLAVFFGSFIIVQIFLSSGQRHRMRAGAGWLLLALAVVEMFVVLPRDFRPMSLGFARQSFELAQTMEHRGIAPAEVRIQDPDGIYVSGGIATIDNGAPAVLPTRLFVFRRTLFDVRGGYFPVRESRYDYSWALTSTGLFPSATYLPGSASPLWTSMQRDEGDQITIDGISLDGIDFTERPGVVAGKQMLHFRGWAVDSHQGQVYVPEVFIVFRSGENVISLPASKVYRPDVANHFGDRRVLHAGWELQIESDILDPGIYEIMVRGTRTAGRTYFEKNTGLMINMLGSGREPEPGPGDPVKQSPGLQYAGSTTRGFVYHDDKALPRAYLASRCFPVDHFSTAVRHLGDPENFRLGDIFIEDLSEAEKSLCLEVAGQEVVRVPIVDDLGKEMKLGAVTGPGVMVLNDNYYPGWQAVDQISGQRLRIKPANITMRAVVLPENREYRVTFTYVPEWLGTARILAWTALTALAAFFCLAMLRTRQGRRAVKGANYLR